MTSLLSFQVKPALPGQQVAVDPAKTPAREPERFVGFYFSAGVAAFVCFSTNARMSSMCSKTIFALMLHTKLCYFAIITPSISSTFLNYTQHK